ncbi:hypothetical protein SD15574_1541 [Shigella dysenteriae 155-74]|nr:hypothetical protein SD15574_1541 [Shigella dysenteriae 155-74]EIQ30568.1 hypothetical protein SB96558_2121 [Shigella boydii 965-58]
MIVICREHKYQGVFFMLRGVGFFFICFAMLLVPFSSRQELLEEADI